MSILTSSLLSIPSFMAGRYSSVVLSLITPLLLLAFYVRNGDSGAALFLRKVIARMNIRTVAPVSPPRPVTLGLKVNTVEEWIRGVLALVPTVSHVYNLSQAAEPYLLAQIITLASRQSFSHDAFMTLPASSARIIFEVLDYVLLHFNTHVSHLPGEPLKIGAEGSFAKLTHLMNQFSLKHRIVPARLNRMGLIKLFDPVSGGGSSDIYKVWRGGRIFAIKELREQFLDNGNPGLALRWFFQEVSILSRLHHKNILPLHGVVKNFYKGQNLPCLVFSWIEHGTVRSYLSHLNALIHATTVLQWLAEVASGLYYLHSRGIVHRDIRGGNIVIGSSKQALIIDLGMAHVVDDPLRQPLSRGGSPGWMAPELLSFVGDVTQHVPRFSGDAYAFACTIIELYTRRDPWGNAHQLDIVVAVNNGRRPAYQHDDIEGLPIELWEVINQAWSQCAEDRLSMQQIEQKICSILDTYK